MADDWCEQQLGCEQTKKNKVPAHSMSTGNGVSPTAMMAGRLDETASKVSFMS